MLPRKPGWCRVQNPLLLQLFLLHSPKHPNHQTFLISNILQWMDSPWLQALPASFRWASRSAQSLVDSLCEAYKGLKSDIANTAKRLENLTPACLSVWTRQSNNRKFRADEQRLARSHRGLNQSLRREHR